MGIKNRSNDQELPFPDVAFPSLRVGHRRVLIECSDPCLGWALDRTLKEAGYDVASCWGPAMGRESCPVIAGGSCRLAESADLIVQSFPSKDRRRFPILEALRKSLPDTPVCVEVAKPSFWKFADALDGCTVVDQPMRSSTLVAAVDDLAARLEKDN